MHTVRVQQHLADVPEYIIPPTLKNLAGISKGTKRKRGHFKSTGKAAAKFQVIFFDCCVHCVQDTKGQDGDLGTGKRYRFR